MNNYTQINWTVGFLGGTSGKESTCQSGRPAFVFAPWVEDPLEKEMATTPVFLPGESHGQRSLAGYSPWNPKQSDITY